MKFIYLVVSIFIFVSAQITFAMDSGAHNLKQLMLDEQFCGQKKAFFEICKLKAVSECYFFLEAYYVNQEKLEGQYNKLNDMLKLSQEKHRLDMLYELINKKSHDIRELLELLEHIWMQPNYDAFSETEKPRVNFSAELQQKLNHAFIRVESFVDFNKILKRIVDGVIKLLESNNIDPLELRTVPAQKQEKCIVS